GRLLGNVFGAAHADRGGGRLHPVVVVIALADRPGDRAQRAAHEEEESALPRRVEAVVVDAEGRSRLKRNDRAVGEPNLHPTVAAGANQVAAFELGAGCDRYWRSLRAF